MKATKSKKTSSAIKAVVQRSTTKPAVKTVKKAVLKPVLKPVSKPMVKVIAKAVTKAPALKASAPVSSSATVLESIRQEVTALRTQLAKNMAPVTTGSMEEVDALRRVLSDLMEARMNDVIRELVTIRNIAASENSQRVTEQMDTLLADLGAMKFEAERLEHVDPLIHAVTREVTDTHLPDGVIAETIRPGFHTGRGIVVAKALVAVNRRP